MATPTPAVTVSPVDAARAAWQHTRSQLFPIRLERWLVLGLLAFQMYAGAGDLQTFHHEATAKKDGTIQYVIEAAGPQGATFTP